MFKCSSKPLYIHDLQIIKLNFNYNIGNKSYTQLY
jgi:hypothetical protein